MASEPSTTSSAKPVTMGGRFRAWFQRRLRPPRRLRVTREGKVFIGVTFGVGFAAINTGNNLLYLVLGLLLSIIVLSGVLSETALRGLQFKRKLPRRAFSGVPMLVEIEVRNSKRLSPSYSIEVEDRIEDRRTDKRCYFLKVSAGARQTAAYRRTPPVRGTERYVSLRVATRFPFGLFEKWREIELVDEQVVYPSPQRGPRPQARTQDTGDLNPSEGRGRGEVDGVRELRDGEPVRDIEWKKTAATGRVIARERKREGTRKLHLEVHNRHERTEENAEPQSDFSKRLEEEVRRVAFLALDALREGTSVEIIAQQAAEGDRAVFHTQPGSRAADQLLTYLAKLPPMPVVVESAT